MEQKTPEDDDARFSNFVKGVVKKAQTKTKCESSDTLRDVIKAQIQTWLDQIVNVNPLYKVSEIIPVGSYAEGTKISHPDEFDYLVVVEEFSKPDIIEIDTDSSDIQQGLVKVVILDQVLKSKCSGLCRDGHLQCFQPVSFPERNPKQQRFGHVLIKHLSMLAKRSKQGGRDSFITVTPTEVQCMMSLPTENNCPFYLKEASFKAPNVFIEFIYNNMIVSVDISPAIRYHKIQDCFIDKECAGPAFAELVLNRQSILLVGTSDESDFKVTVTEAEVEYIQKVMKPEHKIIYIFLKYIVYLYAKMELPLFTFTSYMMKIICIHHDIRCETKERSIQGCFKMVINDLNDSTRKGHVVSIVNKHILLDKGILEKSDREFLLRGIEKMCQLPTDIETVDDFDEFLMEIVKNEGQKKNMERQEREKRNREAQNNFAAKVKEKVAKIVDMGFDKDEAKVALERTWKYDVEQAIRKLRKQEMAMNASKDEDQKFSKFVEGIVTKAQTETKCENSDTLRDVIRTQIQTWLNEVENVNPLYKVSELIPVGSYAEGTKIIQPDEFDYLVVIEEFSKPDMIRIDTNEEDIRHGLVKIVVENEGLNAKCTGLCKDGHLKCFQPINYARLGEKRFGHVLIQTLWMIVKRSVKFSQPTTGSPTEIDCKIFLLTIYNIPLYFKGAEFMAPNVLIKFEYKTMEVTVDVSPAIRYHNIYDCFRQKDCAGPTFAELILSRKSLLFVGTDRKSDFKVTVTEAEVEYIQRVMKPEHKIIYIFLKYLLQLYKDVGRIPFIFTSYMMKTVCIHHDIKCEKNERSIKECFKLVMNELNDCTRQEYVVSIVNKNIRLTKDDMNMYHREFFLHGMEKMCQIPTDVTTVDDFDRYLKLIVQNEGQKKLKAEREIRMENEKYYESFCAELQEKVSKIVDMGYDPVEVEEVMKRYLYDSEQAILILQRRAKKREEEKLSQKFSSLSSHQIPAEDSPKQSTCEEGHPNGQSNELSDSSHTCQEQPEQSGKCLVALNSSQKSVTDEILNQRQKDI